LDDLGIAAAIEWHLESLSKSTGIKTELFITPENLTLDRERSITIYRIVQEALTNVIRHSEATKVMVTLEKNDEIKLTIEDNGKGIHEDNLTSLNSFGITGMQERINYWNGEFSIRGVPDEGTMISVKIPTA
jgi:signal transduction histidine kinase